MVRREKKIPGEVRNETKSKAGQGGSLKREKEKQSKTSFEYQKSTYSKAKFVIGTSL